MAPKARNVRYSESEQSGPGLVENLLTQETNQSLAAVSWPWKSTILT